MRHRCGFRKLSRDATDRIRMLKQLSTHLFEHEAIETTITRAKELRRYAEKTITLGKRELQSSQLMVFARVNKPEIGSKLLTQLVPRYEGRPGGYTRILPMGPRNGDKVPMARIELVDSPLSIGSKLRNLK